MRKFLIKHFVLDYRYSIGNFGTSIPRAAHIIMPLMLINGFYQNSIYPLWNYQTNIGIFLLILLGLSIGISFIYLRNFPAKWSELSYNQKKQAAQGISSGFVQDKLTDEEREEMYEILEEVNKFI